MVHGAFLIESGCYPKIIQTGWSMENYGKLAWRTHMLGNLHMSPIAMATFGIFWCYDSPISPIFGQPISQIVCFPSDIRRSKWWTTRQQWWLVHLSSVQIQVFISVIWDSAPLTRRSQHCLWQHHDRKVAPLGLWDQIFCVAFWGGDGQPILQNAWKVGVFLRRKWPLCRSCCVLGSRFDVGWK